MRKPTYISTDVEYSWDSLTQRGQWSILSIGSCELANINNSFYRELQPINKVYNESAMRVITPWIHFIWDGLEELSWEEVLDRLEKYGMPPKMALQEYTDWLAQFKSEHIREIACPIKFDGGLTSYYFREFFSWDNPLSHSGEDWNSMLRGFLWDSNMSFRKLWIESLAWELPHNALKDSQIQSIWIEFLLKLMQDNKDSKGELQRLYMQKWKEKLLESRDIRQYIIWVWDMVSSIQDANFWEEVEYNSIL